MSSKQIHSQECANASIRRYLDLFRGKKVSVLRALQYEKLASIQPLKGRVFDFGGGNNADYLKLIDCTTYESANIDKKMDPTFLTKPGEPLDVPAKSYDYVISLNTLEHVYDARFYIREMKKLLKPSGQLICTVPFLYPVHAHPDDFFRPTESWWATTLEMEEFFNINITPLLWGPFSTAITCSGTPGPFKMARKNLALLLDVAYASMKPNITGSTSNYPLGYFVTARL